MRLAQKFKMEDGGRSRAGSVPDYNGSVHRGTRWGKERGQALTEFAIIGTVLLFVACGVIDLGRAIYQKQVITHLTREGSNMAARGTDLTTAAGQVVLGASPLNLTTSGYVIITAVQNDGTNTKIIDQAAQGGKPASSRFGAKGANASNLPVTTPQIPQTNQTMFITEVFYNYQPATPIGKLMGVVLPSTLYDVAYF